MDRKAKFVALVVLHIIILAIALFYTRGCALEKKPAANAEDTCPTDPELRIREAACPAGKVGKTLEACIKSVWVVTYDKDCKDAPVDVCSKTAFDKVVEPVLEANCKSCHSGFTDYGTAKTKIDQFISRIKADPGSRMPKGKDPLSATDIAKFEQWKADGLLLTCPDEPEGPTQFLDLRYQESAAQNDANTVALGAQGDLRWLTTAHKINEGEKKAVTKKFEQAIHKGINSISSARGIVLAKAVDPNGAVFRISLADYKLTANDWRLIEDADPLNLESKTNIGLTLRRITGTRKPMMSVDAFLAAATSANVYYQIRNIAGQLRNFEDGLGVDLVNQVQKFEALQVGVAKGTISLNKNRLLLRLNGNAGPVWQALDTDRTIVSNDRNLSQFPLILSFARRNFKADASETIFSLSNGLHGYAVFSIQNAIGNVQGQRLNEASQNVVAHNLNPPADSTIRVASSCFRCHNGGFIPRPDDVKAAVDRNATLFDLRDVDLVDQIYRDPKADFDRDNGDYAVALSRLGILASDSDPVTVSLDNLLERPLGVKELASFFSFTQDQFITALKRSSQGLQQIGQVLDGHPIGIEAFKKILPILIEDFRYGQEPIR